MKSSSWMTIGITLFDPNILSLSLSCPPLSSFFLKQINLIVTTFVTQLYSPDGTYQIAEQLRDIYGPQIVCTKRAGKLGLGSAYIFGNPYNPNNPNNF